MSDSDGIKDDRPGWVIPGVGFVALVLSAALLWATWATYSNWNESQQNAKEIEAYSNRYTVERCTRLYPVERSECIDKATQAAQDQHRNEADLYAQRQMAVWAVLVAVCAAISIPLSLAGILFVWRSLALNRAAVSAALGANSVAQKMGEAQTRAYLVCVGADYTINSQCVICNPKIKNTGDSPAHDIEIEGSICIHFVSHKDGLFNPLTTEFHRASGFHGHCQTVASGEIETGIAVILSSTIGHAAFDRLYEEDVRFDVGLRIYWRDVFGAKHTFTVGLDIIHDSKTEEMIGLLSQKKLLKGEMDPHNKDYRYNIKPT